MFPTPKYLTRDAAAAFLASQGIPTTGPQLADLAYRDKGPRYAKIRGRAVYTEEWLLEWILHLFIGERIVVGRAARARTLTALFAAWQLEDLEAERAALLEMLSRAFDDQRAELLTLFERAEHGR